VELEENRAALEKRGMGLAAISHDSVELLAEFAGRRKLGYPLLSDEGSRLIEKLGILNTQLPLDNPRRGIPHPGTFVLDGQGRVVSKSFVTDIRERETLGSILMTRGREAAPAGGMAAGGMVAETSHLSLATEVSNPVARQFQVLRLRLKVKLKPGMHVYAPGAKGYKVVQWDMEPSAAYTMRKVQFPPPKELYLAAIQERIAVYEGEFGMDAELALRGNKEASSLLDAAGNLDIAGTFTYQACDDKTCFLPVKVPVRWQVRFENLAEPRSPERLQRKAPAALNP
jgi:DsbC/DsbD-like thiol-disulfide interchange protein